MKKIIMGVVYTLWGVCVLLLSSIPYVSADSKYLDVLLLGCIIVALSLHLRLKEFKGKFPLRYICMYTLCLVVLANVLGLIGLGLMHFGSL